jgi:hypothetical protein
VTKCVNSGGPTIPCTNQMVVTLVLGSSTVEQVQGFINSATTDAGGALRLQAPIVINVGRSPEMGSVYPLSYRQTTNNQPFEVDIDRSLTDWCDDSSSSATCGVVRDSVGNIVPYSQGFCCSFLQTNRFRSGSTSSAFGAAFSASCLRFDDIWYDVYDIGLSQTVFDVQVNVSFTNATTGLQQNSTIVLSTNSLIGVSDDGAVMGQLLGQFASFQAVPALGQTSLYFYPARPVGGARQQEGFAGSLLVPLSMVDLTGRTPNRIGASFEAFYNQPQACTNPAGAGLQGQLDSLYKADKKRVAGGLAPQYLASVFGPTLTLKSNPRNSSRYLYYPVAQPPNVAITLTINADDIAFVQNQAPGKISSAFVNPFETQSKNGVMRVLVSNVGLVSASYFVSVTECSVNILPVLGQEVTVNSYASQWLEFSITSTTPLGSNANVCAVTLKDSQGSVQDKVLVYFNTSDTVIDQGAQGGNAPNISGASVGSAADLVCGQCSFFAIGCQIGGGCVGGLLKAAGSVLLPLAGALVLIKLLTMPSVRSLLGRLLCGCCQGKQVVYVNDPPPRPPTIVYKCTAAVRPGLLGLVK